MGYFLMEYICLFLKKICLASFFVGLAIKIHPQWLAFTFYYTLYHKATQGYYLWITFSIIEGRVLLYNPL